jgi:hypothetical protein
MKNIYFIFILSICIFPGCKQSSQEYKQVNAYPEIYPDYKDICVPYNIAPLNFMLKEECDKMEVELLTGTNSMKVTGSHKIAFPLDKFKMLLQEHKNDTIWVSVKSHSKLGWQKFKSFYWKVIPEEIDAYLTYRLIEPGYEVWNKIALAERNISNFDETYIADNNLVDGSCMNCHIGSKQNPEKSFFHIRGPKGMTVIADGKKLRKLNTKTEGAYSNMIYGNWHPSGKFISFSTNVVIPSFHNYRDKRAFVYDTISDVVVLDIDKNEVLTNPLLSKKEYLETFPEFSADGKKLYFCSAHKVKLPEDYEKLKYSLCSIDFDSKNRTFSDHADTLVNGPLTGKTVSEPKSSPDGKYLMFTSFSYGTFPIWHADARIFNFNLKTGVVDTLPELNNNKKYSNSYHSWSTNSKWVVFASKRDNGMYGKPYFSYIDTNGKAHKPFVLPQKDAEFYDYTYKSFNIPELFKKPRMFNASDIEELFKDKSPTEKVKPFK